MNPHNLIKTPYYPYHLTWEELNNPQLVVQRFLEKWELPHSRKLLRKKLKAIKDAQYFLSEEEKAEIKLFLNDFERLIEALYLIELQQQQLKNP